MTVLIRADRSDSGFTDSADYLDCGRNSSVLGQGAGSDGTAVASFIS